MRASKNAVIALAVWLAVPTAALAQAAIAGVVKDTSGAVLPGVTVEASSPALIEKVRSVVTDGTGQYTIVNLRPGTYTVNFSLTGFNALKREGIELSGSFTATVNVELKVGALEETITVSGESPIVDVQGVKQQRVLGKEVIDVIPSARSHITVAVLVPGVGTASGTAGTNQDVGGSLGDPMTSLVVHGSQSTDQRVNLDGLATNNDSGFGSRSGFVPNMSSSQEVVVDIAAGGAEQQTGGVRINIIPREGGNRFSGTTFLTGTKSAFQGSNYSQELRDRGLKTPSSIISMYEFNPGVGGPVMKDKLWFYVAVRKSANRNYAGGLFENLNAGNPNVWTYAPDLTRPAIYPQDFHNENGRLTWQVTSKNKVSIFYQTDYRCQCPRINGTNSPEAEISFTTPLERLVTLTWFSPLTSRVLFEAAVSNHGERWRDALTSSAIGVNDQALGLSYRGAASVSDATNASSLNGVSQARASVSYVTGSHAFKVGIDDKWSFRRLFSDSTNPSGAVYRFNNGVPNLITEGALPYTAETDNPVDLALFAQDKWTVDRFTFNLGIRFQYYTVGFPDQHVGPGPLVPTRDISFPASSVVSWKDVMPRLGVAYNLFGGGKTVLKATLNKYIVETGIGSGSVFGHNLNPIVRLANTITRSWDDTHSKGINNDFVPQCNLLSPLANGECGPMSDQNFGQATSAIVYDSATFTGWGKRPYDWEFSTSVQRELVPRLSLNVGYFRRIYGNFVVTDNLAVSASDYSPFYITAPVNAGLLSGGGYVISGLYDLNQNMVGHVSNYLTFSDNYGTQIQHWNGVDVTIDARPRSSVLVQGGLSTGSTVTDNCEVRAQLPEIGPLNPYCHTREALQTQVKLLGAYTIPKITTQVSAAFQSFPGPPTVANYVASNANIVPSLGRNLSGGATNATVNLISPGSIYGDRVNQLDLRFSKILRFARVKTTVSADLYNALNVSPALTENAAYASFRVPINTLMARFARFTLQLDF